ncbi:MAG: hypothetical protein IJ593_08140 [Lachnospiraceae bacterium]|nr:hypothetical protein [Lachnospiraceae bacterium]
MTLIDKLEKKLSFLNFPNLNLYMVVVFLLATIIDTFNPIFYYANLSLNMDLVMKGEIWRFVTFIFYPITSSRMLLLSLVMIYVYYSITKTLIMMWGNFKFNLYLFIGYISQILAALILYFILGEHIIFVPIYTTFSIIMAFALSFPDSHFLIYFLIPIKAKYFAYFEMVLYVISFLGSDLSGRVAIICGAANVFIFFVLLKNKI